MKHLYQQFIFEDYEFDTTNKVARFHYSFDGQLKFTETFEFLVDLVDYDPAILDQALFGLWLIAGVSYYKAYLPPQIVVKKGQLSQNQAEFFDKIYLNGLAQFLYTNQLNPDQIAKFPFSENDKQLVQHPATYNSSGALVAIGGGKDSIVAAELLKQIDVEYSTWVMYHKDRFEPMLKQIGKPSFGVNRRIDPQLQKINEHNAYNGHVPVTAIVGFAGVVLAVLSGKKSFIWAIEASTDEPSTIWKGLPVNHQYAKSSMFEADMVSYLQQFVSNELEYYSLLRPLTELRIAEVFCKNYFDTYKHLFSSCNANFKLGDTTQKLIWCGKCPKCAFVYAIFSPFLTKAQLMDLFDGRDLFADETLQGTYEQLLGIDGIKPLECVGEIAEVRTAVQMAKDSGQYPELARFDFSRPDYDYKKWHSNSIPKVVEARLRSILSDT